MQYKTQQEQLDQLINRLQTEKQHLSHAKWHAEHYKQMNHNQHGAQTSYQIQKQQTQNLIERAQTIYY